MSSDDTPVSRLRERHAGLHQCDAYWFRPGPSERCPTIAALDALQARINEAAGMFDSALWWIGEDWLRDRIRAWLAGDKEAE